MPIRCESFSVPTAVALEVRKYVGAKILLFLAIVPFQNLRPGWHNTRVLKDEIVASGSISASREGT